MTAHPIKQDAKQFLVFAALLATVLAILFFRSFDPNEVIFSNDGPYGGMCAQHARMPQILTGYWQDLNWLGYTNPSMSPTLSALWLWTGPLIFSKTFCPFSLFVLGIFAWWCFRQWKLSYLASALGGFSVALSSHFFSTACWGVAAQVIAIGWAFVALGFLANYA